jgi:hypothetical protein
MPPVHSRQQVVAESQVLPFEHRPRVGESTGQVPALAVSDETVGKRRPKGPFDTPPPSTLKIMSAGEGWRGMLGMVMVRL